MIVWVVGSGPTDELPEQTPDIIYYVNGGVFRKQSISSGDVVERLITTAHVLAEPGTKKSEQAESVCELVIENAPYDFLWVRDTLSVKGRDVAASELATRLSEKRAVLDFDSIYRLLLYVLGRSSLVKSVLLSFLHGPLQVSLSFSVGFARGASIKRLICNMRKMKVSTGVLGLLVALFKSDKGDTFYLVGVTAGNSPYANSGALAKRDNHIEADLNVLRKIASGKLWKVIIMDQRLKEIVNG